MPATDRVASSVASVAVFFIENYLDRGSAPGRRGTELSRHTRRRRRVLTGRCWVRQARAVCDTAEVLAVVWRPHGAPWAISTILDTSIRANRQKQRTNARRSRSISVRRKP